MAAGSIVIDLLLRSGSFETDTARAAKNLKQLQRDAEAAGKAIGLAMVGAVAGLTYMVKSTIDAADHLNDLSQKTGIAADTLGGIGFAASKAGLDLDSVAAGAGKLNKSLADAAAGGKETGAVFAALGISVKDAAGNTKNADTVIAEVADKFAGYADGPEKAAIALKLFGKAGADMIPLLNGGGQALQDQIDYFKRYSGVTVETAKAADEFNDKIGDLKLLTGAFGQTLARDLLGPLTALADYLKKSKEEAGAFSIAIAGIRVVFETVSVVGSDVVFVLTQIGKGMVAVADGAVRLAHLDFQGVQTVFSEYNKQARTARASLDDFQARVLGVNEKIGGGRGFVNPAFAAGAKPSAPRIPGAAALADDPTKKLFENQLKALEAFVQQERDLMQSRNRFLDFYNSQGLLSIQSYFDARQTINKAALTAELSAIDQEIALAKKRSQAPGVSERDKADAQGKLEKLTRRRAKIEQQAGEEGLALSLQQEQAYKALADQLLSLNAQVADLGENFRLAAAVKFDLQFDALKRTFTAEGNAQGLQAIKTLRDAALAQADFQKASLETGRTLDSLHNTEDRIALAQQTGALTSLDALVKVGAARRAQIPALEAQVAAEEAIAKASGNKTLIQNAEAARLALDKLKASADPLAESLNKTFGDDFNSALDDFVTGTKSAADAFKSFAKSVLNDILKLGSKSLAESIFGGSGGAGGLISSLFGGGGSGSTVSSLASLFSGFFADGGTIPPGRFGIVGERGPEVAFGGTTGKTITPMAGGSRTNYINVNVPAGAKREYGTQVGADIARQLAIADRRNN